MLKHRTRNNIMHSIYLVLIKEIIGSDLYESGARLAGAAGLGMTAGQWSGCDAAVCGSNSQLTTH